MIRVFSAILNIFLPGLGFTLSGYTTVAICLSILELLIVVLFSWSRFILTPEGMIILFVLFIFIALSSAITSLFIEIKPSSLFQQVTKSLCHSFIMIAIIAITFTNKEDWLGVDLYFIPSMSMHPTLVPGDFILVDSWDYKNKEPEVGNIVIVQHQNSILIKRIAQRQPSISSDGLLYFLVGDNPVASQDSRHFGYIKQHQIKAKAELVLFSLTDDYRLNPKRVLLKIN